MKFKQKSGYAELLVTDSSGDTLELKRFDDSRGRPNKEMYVYINEGVGVRLTRAKALKVAYAIINELGPQD